MLEVLVGLEVEAELGNSKPAVKILMNLPKNQKMHISSLSKGNEN